MKTKLLSLTALLLSLTVNAQTKTNSNHSIGINILGVEYSYEQRLGGAFSLNSSVGLGSNIIFSTYEKTYFDLTPHISIAPRYYYNLNKRAKKGLNVHNNSANYFAVTGSCIFKPIAQNMDINYRTKFSIVPQWGVKRVYNDRWLLDFNIGVNILFDNIKHVGVGPNANIKFGYIF